MPDQFSRVITWIGSFTSVQWKEDPAIPMEARKAKPLFRVSIVSRSAC
jgi:hypothetical protein